MQYVSTRGGGPQVDFTEALLAGIAPDGGLYVPESWPHLDPEGLAEASYAEVLQVVLSPFVAGSDLAADLEKIVADVYADWRHPEIAPLRQLDDHLHLLELFHGPTLSFKDYALAVLGRFLDAALTRRSRRVTVIGATSGDTGSAAIAACRDRAALDVVILYPEGRVSEVQRRQMTTVTADNVRAVAVDGTFDDCQDLVKAVLTKPTAGVTPAAVNSINWGRVIGQMAYYAWTTLRLGPSDFAVPTGNFGNVFSGWVARRIGFPVGRLIIANNRNHLLAQLVEKGWGRAEPVHATLAPAMDIQVPSNLERYLYEHLDHSGVQVEATLRAFRATGEIRLDERAFAGFAASWGDDRAIIETIRTIYQRHGLVVDPHTALAWAAATTHRLGSPMVVLATAHPAKFPEAIREAIGTEPALPADLADLLGRPERSYRLPNDLAALHELLAT